MMALRQPPIGELNASAELEALIDVLYRITPGPGFNCRGIAHRLTGILVRVQMLEVVNMAQRRVNDLLLDAIELASKG